jgi:ABC-type proline/glycine betaine transport system permease subunit
MEKSYLNIAFSVDKRSGLSESIAQALQFLDGIPSAAVIIIVIVISGLFTEVTSNVSTASIFLPVLDSVVCLNISPNPKTDFLSSRRVHWIFIRVYLFFHAL